MATTEVSQCFLCCDKIEKTTDSSLDPFESSFILKHILEVPQLDIYLERVKDQEIFYCSECSTKIAKIRDVLEELEKLEKILLDEKYEIELQFRKNSDTHSTDEGQGQELVQQIRSDIVTDLKSSAIYSMMEKLYKKQLGRRPEARKSFSVSGIRPPTFHGGHNKSYRIFPQRRSGVKVNQVRLNNKVNLPQPHSSQSASHQFQSTNSDEVNTDGIPINMTCDVATTESGSDPNYEDIFQPEILINDEVEVGPEDYQSVKLEDYDDPHGMIIERHVDFPAEGGNEDLLEEKYVFNSSDQGDPESTGNVGSKSQPNATQRSITPHVVGWPEKPPRRPRVRICTNSFESLEAFDTANALENQFPRTYCKFHERNYSTRRELRVHVKAMHLPAALKYKCDWPTCEKVFSKPSTLLRHTRAHKTNISKAEFMNINLSGLPS